MNTGAEDKEKKQGEPQIGFQFNAPVNAPQATFINDAENVVINQGLSVGELGQLDELFKPLKDEVKAAPEATRPQAEAKADELHEELAKGKSASAERLGKIVDALTDMVPGALAAVVSMFGSPILGALVGPATKLVLDHIQGK